MSIEQAIKEAIKNGYELDFRDEDTVGAALLNPAFWQALGKARGWDYRNTLNGEPMGENYAWLAEWHRFIDHLAEGKDAESFFASL